MLDALRDKMAYWIALRDVGRRRRGSRTPDLHARKVLVVLPSEVAAVDAAWRFVERIDLGTDRVTLVQAGNRSEMVPEARAGLLRSIGPAESNLVRLPRQETAQTFWSERPDVAIDLHPRFDLPGAFLVGCSPAWLRVGFYHERATPFFDFMMNPTGEPAQSIDALYRYLSNLNPPAIPFRTP